MMERERTRIEPPCCGVELLAAYLDGGLAREERERCEEHLASCDRCLAELASVRSELDAAAREGWLPSAGAERPARLSPIARLASILVPAPQGRRAALAAGAAICAAFLMAGGLFGFMRSPGWDPDFLEGRSAAARVLAAADIGDMRLAGAKTFPPDSVSATRGGTGYESESLARAVGSLERARERHAGDWRAYRLLGDLGVAAGRIEEADRLYARAIELRPEDAALLANRGVAAWRAGDAAGARSYLEAALAADPRLPEAVYNLAVLCRDLGDREGAERYRRLYLEIDRSSAWSDRLRPSLAP